MKKLSLLTLITALVTSPAILSQEQENQNLKEVELTLVYAKLHGMCGLVQQMFQFQDSTKLKGGDEFINRFMTTELARLSLTADQFFTVCEKSAASYDQNMKDIKMLSQEN